MLSLNLRRQILGHLEEGDKTTGLPLAEILIKMFPKYRFTGVGYRVIISLEEIGEIKLNPGDSFSSDPESCEQFLEDHNYMVYEDQKAVIVKAEIVGFNLEKLIREEMNQFPEGDHEDLQAYLAESEIIALEIIKVIDEFDVDFKKS